MVKLVNQALKMVTLVKSKNCSILLIVWKAANKAWNQIKTRQVTFQVVIENEEPEH